MWTVIKVLGLIWLSLAILIGIMYLWFKLTQQPYSEEYEEDDF